MATSPNTTCPVCHLPHAVVPHCQSPTCSWIRCEKCRIILDPCTGHGWDHEGKSIQLGTTNG